MTLLGHWPSRSSRLRPERRQASVPELPLYAKGVDQLPSRERNPFSSWRRSMTGPFPGMDPYLEAQGLWESFHAPLVTNSAPGSQPEIARRLRGPDRDLGRSVSFADRH